MAQSTPQQFHTAEDLARIERQTARFVDLKGSWIGLLGATLIFVASLFLPFTGKATGIDVLLLNDKAAEFGATPLEQFYIVCGIATLVVANILVVVTKRAAIAYTTWILTGTTLVLAMFMIWIGQTRQGALGSSGTEFGAIINFVAVVLSTAVISAIAFRRSDEQIDLAEARREVHSDDIIENVQGSASYAKRYSRYEDNPLFVDDRRARAARRHQQPPAED